MADTGEWLLKIISGPHQGAEVPLHAGRAIVGSHADCDLVLHDVLVAAQHFALTLEGGTMAVEPIEGTTFCNGKRVTTLAPVPSFAFLTAGTTHVVVGPAAARWPLISLADVPALEKEAPPPPPPEPAPAPAAAAPADAKAPKAPTPEQRKRALWTAGVGGALLLVWVVLWLMYGPRTQLAPKPGVRDRAEQVLKAFPDAKSVKLQEHADRLVATGYVASDSAQRELAAAFREDVPEVSVRIWSMPRLVDTARSVLANRNLEMDVSAAGDGELRVRGTVKSSDDWQRARRILLAEVPGLTRLQEDITIAAPVRGSKAGAAASTATAPEKLSIIALQELGGGQGWLRLSNGQVLFRGARLPDGATVVGFHEGRAAIDRAGTRLDLSVGADLDGPAPVDTAVQVAAPAAAAPVAVQEKNPQKG